MNKCVSTFSHKLALVYKQISQCRVTLSPGSTLSALPTCFVMREILCNGRKFEIISEVLYRKHVEFTKKKKKKGKYYHRRQNITFYFSDVYN